MHRFFAEVYTDNKTAELYDSEAHHCTHVLRLTSGDQVELINGKGKLYYATIDKVSRKVVYLSNLKPQAIENAISIPLKIALAPPKSSDRLQFIVEKLTEIGVKEILFFQSFHSERRKINLDKLRKIAIGGLKQSKNLWLPDLKETNFDKILNEGPHQKFYGSLENGTIPINSLEINSSQDSVFLIGPEGDFSKEEYDKLKESSCKPIGLGKSVFRTETATILGAYALSLKYESN